MKTVMAIIACGIILAGCNTREKELEKQNAELQSKSDGLYKELTSRDQYIEEVMGAINDMHENLAVSREKEKLIMKESGGIEGSRSASSAQVRQRMLQQISEIDSGLKSNKKKLEDLQARVKSNRTQIASLNKMVSNLKQTLEEREQSIAQLETTVKSLQEEVGTKTAMIAERDATIGQQQTLISQQSSTISTAFYIVGTRAELEQKGIIADQGGFLWGLFGSTTVLASGFDNSLFKPINKTREMNIEVKGQIDEILPRRNRDYYATSAPDKDHSSLQILRPESFWQDMYLVIITD